VVIITKPTDGRRIGRASRPGHHHHRRHRRYREDIGRRLCPFYRWRADADIPELTTLAETIQTWWPAIEVFLTTEITNARTERTN
jgi:transposase